MEDKEIRTGVFAIWYGGLLMGLGFSIGISYIDPIKNFWLSLFMLCFLGITGLMFVITGLKKVNDN